MMNVLQEIAERTKERIEVRKKALPIDRIVELAQSGGSVDDFPFEKALRSQHPEDIAFICEIKKASPSKGVIAEDFPYLNIAKDYETAGAAAISVLTEPYWFEGDDRYLREIADTVSLPLLRKDFTVDSYMIYEAKVLGASAVLLICSLLNQETLAEYIDIAHSLGLSALVEVHDEDEMIMALCAGARIIGVNNRNLKTFEVDTGNSIRLRKLAHEMGSRLAPKLGSNLAPKLGSNLAPELGSKEILFVSESGIKTAEDIDVLRKNGVDAVLIGETLMRSPDKKAALAELKGGSLKSGSYCSHPLSS